MVLRQASTCGKCCGDRKWLEVYSHPSNRYLTVTGNRFGGAPTVTDQQAALDWLHERFMEVKPISTGRREDHPSPVETPLNFDDLALLDKAKRAKNGDEFSALWNGDVSRYPSHSEADQALANRLAF